MAENFAEPAALAHNQPRGQDRRVTASLLALVLCAAPEPEGTTEPQSGQAAPAVERNDEDAAFDDPQASSKQGYFRGGPREDMARFSMAGHAMLGPHAPGEEACEETSTGILCDRTGQFVGLGASLEARIRLFRALGLSVRAAGAHDVARYDPPYRAWITPALGLGLYSRLAFLRAEYGYGIAIGDGLYRGAGSENEPVYEEWKPHFGTITGAVRLRLGHDDFRGEFGAGVVIGPYKKTTRPDLRNRVEPGVSASFLVLVGLSWDAKR